STSKGFAEAKLNQNNEFSISIFKFEKENTEFRTQVFSLCRDDKNNLIAATNRGIYIFDDAKNSFKPFFENNKTELLKTPLECFSAFWKNNKLYFSVSNKFFSYSESTSKIYNISLQQSNYIS